MKDIRQSREWGEYLKKRGWKVDRVKRADGKGDMQVLILQIVPWPVAWMKVQRMEHDPDFEDLKRLKKKYHVICTNLEPIKIEDPDLYNKYKFKISKYPFLPRKTIIIDLDQSEEDLWKNLSENARRLINKNKDLKVTEIDKKEYLKHWKKSAKVWTISEKDLTKLLDSFKDKARMEVIGDEDGYHSGLITLYTKDTANYFVTWTGDLGRKSGAHYKFVWESILTAKRLGKKYYDFEGIYDEEFPNKKWLGFTEFKKKFGGEVVTYPGLFDKWF